jgi:hypothetical protein
MTLPSQAGRTHDVRLLGDGIGTDINHPAHGFDAVVRIRPHSPPNVFRVGRCGRAALTWGSDLAEGGHAR